MDTTSETKRERRLAARAERQRLAEEGRRRARQRRRLTLGGLVLVAVAIVVAGIYFIGQTALRPSPGRTLPDEGRTHVNSGEPIEYRNNPPASGPHYPTWTRPGVYTDPQDKGYWVHSLEHGYVVILYNCPSGCPDLVQQLRQFYEAAPKSSRYGYQKLVITPYTEMSHTIALVAWDHIEEMDQFSADDTLTFYKAYLDKGPEDAP
jgi:hypothetical protein